MTTAPTDSAITETADAVGIRSSALFGVCATCEYWRPEPRHKLWGRCGRVDHAMQYGAITRYPYDEPESKRVRLNPSDNEGRISTYRDFGCNRYLPNAEAMTPGATENDHDKS